MASEPSFDQLRKGVLYFPPESPDSRPAPAFIQFATAATWADWSRVGKAELWKLVALSVHLEPQSLPWRDIPRGTARPVEIEGHEAMVVTYPETACGLFLERLREATNDVLAMSTWLPTVGSIAKPAEESVVCVLDFVRWAENEMISLPPLFPTGDIPAELPHDSHPRRPSRPRPGASSPPPPNGNMRLPEVLALVGFSAATLWRKVKAETFPLPSKASTRITTWNRAEVDEWLAKQPASGGRRRRSKKVPDSS